MVQSIFTCADAIFGGTTIRQIVSTDHQTNQEHRKAMTSGGAIVQQVSGKSSAEVTTFSSGDIGALLGMNSDLFISDGVSLLLSTITIAKKMRAAGGQFQGVTSHPAITGSNAFILPTSIEASQDADMATLSGEVHWISTDGVTKGADDSSGLTLGAQSFNAEYAMGPCYINGTLLAGAQSFRVTPGIEVVKPPLGSGSVFPTQVSIKNGIPMMEVTVNDWAAVDSTIGDFTAMTSAVFYLRKRADAAVYTGGATDISITFGGGLTDTNGVSTSNNDDGSGTITLHGKALTISTGATIP